MKLIRCESTGSGGRAEKVPGVHAGDLVGFAELLGRRIACACGFQADVAAEFDDHMLLVLTPPDGIGNDGDKHIPVDPSTPIR